MEIFIYVLIGLGVLVVVFILIVAMRPSEFRIVRTGTIAAPPEAVFPHVNDFHNWNAWSPWAKIDPNMQQTYSGPPSGNDAVYHWVGNKKVGEGRMTIMESLPHHLIRIRLEFLKPFTATNATEFTFAPQDGQTLVTWSMTGKNNFMLKAVGLFMNMDKLVGGDFEKGIEQMRKVVEGRS